MSWLQPRCAAGGARQRRARAQQLPTCVRRHISIFLAQPAIRGAAKRQQRACNGGHQPGWGPPNAVYCPCHLACWAQPCRLAAAGSAPPCACPADRLLQPTQLQPTQLQPSPAGAPAAADTMQHSPAQPCTRAQLTRVCERQRVVLPAADECHVLALQRLDKRGSIHKGQAWKGQGNREGSGSGGQGRGTAL